MGISQFNACTIKRLIGCSLFTGFNILGRLKLRTARRIGLLRCVPLGTPYSTLSSWYYNAIVVIVNTSASGCINIAQPCVVTVMIGYHNIAGKDKLGVIVQCISLGERSN